MERIITLSRVIHREFVTRLWPHIRGARLAVFAGLFAVVFTAVFASAALLTHALQPPHATAGRPDPHLLRSDPRAAGRWFQLAHEGRRPRRRERA